jgi:hypothetical protein
MFLSLVGLPSENFNNFWQFHRVLVVISGAKSIQSYAGADYPELRKPCRHPLH